MSINVKKTREYYETFLPCNCGDCRFFSNTLKLNKVMFVIILSHLE